MGAVTWSQLPQPSLAALQKRLMWIRKVQVERLWVYQVFFECKQTLPIQRLENELFRNTRMLECCVTVADSDLFWVVRLTSLLLTRIPTSILRNTRYYDRSLHEMYLLGFSLTMLCVGVIRRLLSVYLPHTLSNLYVAESYVTVFLE